MKNNKKDMLKKHHFWILFGLVPLLVLIATLMISSGVGGKIDEETAKITTAESNIKSKTNPKPNVLIDKMGETIKFIDSKQEGLWKGSYSPQKNLYSMLDSRKLQPIERMGLRFGDKIPNPQDEYEEFKKKEVYTKRFENMAERVVPTMFAGGWQRILRHVNTWTDVKLSSEQIWLLMEDIWVQDSLLEAVSSVNAQMAKFTRVKYVKDGQVIDDPLDKEHQDPLRRKFGSRTWEIELEVVQKGSAKILKGTLINITDKLQLMGVGNIMTLKVWLEEGDNVTPFEFKIGGECLAGEGATRLVRDKNGDREVKLNVQDIIYSDDHIIPPGMGVAKIDRVEQVFDGRTVPIRAIEEMALGRQDSRNAELPLKPPFGKNFADEPAAASTASTGSTITGGSSGGPPGGTKPGVTGMGMGGLGGSQNSARTLSGGGTVATVIDANKARYLPDPTEQVRRMPIGMVLITDQSYLQDVLLAFANSPLRFQITQVTWNRYRGTLLGTGNESGTIGSPGYGGSSGSVMSGSGRFGDGLGSVPGPGKARPGGPSGLSPFGPAGGSLPYGGSGMGGGPSNVSEAQLTSGLIELKVYGIVSLYTSPEPPAVDPNATDPKKEKDPKDKGTGPKDPASKDPVQKDPAQKDPVQKGPTGTDPKNPKN